MTRCSENPVLLFCTLRWPFHDRPQLPPVPWRIVLKSEEYIKKNALLGSWNGYHSGFEPHYQRKVCLNFWEEMKQQFCHSPGWNSILLHCEEADISLPNEPESICVATTMGAILRSVKWATSTTTKVFHLQSIKNKLCDKTRSLSSSQPWNISNLGKGW